MTDLAEACPIQPWYAVQVRGRREQSTAKRYADLGFAAWLPTYKTESQWSDRVKLVERPLIPGYVFVRIPSAAFVQAIGVLHVIKVLGTNMFPTAISDEEISRFRGVIDAAVTASPSPHVAGSKVTIRKGPLAGQEGVVVRVKGGARLIVSIAGLHRSISIEISEECL